MRGAQFRDAARAVSTTESWEPLVDPISGAEIPSISSVKSLSRDDRAKIAILRTVSGSSLEDCSWMTGIAPRRWRGLLCWMDYHGLALYFFDRVVEAQGSNLLPAEIRSEFHRRLDENTARTRSMIAESIAIQREFQNENVLYALLKGASLSPSSAPRPELRLQFDVDFRVAEQDMPEAEKILIRKGYRLYAVDGRHWEFKRNERPGIGLKELYRDTNSWRVELHSEPAGSENSGVLERVEWREIGGFMTPTLSPMDMFSGQGLHACKHVRTQFCRASYLVEFRRHVLFRFGDERFWTAVERRLSGNPQACLKLGIVIALAEKVTGEFASPALKRWTVSTLSPSIRLWIEMYGSRSVCQDFPGSKLFLLLEKALEERGLTAKSSVPRSLIPFCVPPLLFRGVPREGVKMWLKRYRVQCGLLLGRLRFHFVEGFRFVWEFRRWRRELSRVAG
jgi:hypothetical protein